MKQVPPAKKCQAGFTLVEMLCTAATLLLISMLMVTGIKLAVDTYTESIMLSEAQVLCATLKTLVSDELRYAGSLATEQRETDSGEMQTVVTGFFSQTYGKDVTFQEQDGQLLLGGKKLLPANAYPHGLKASLQMDSFTVSTRVFYVTLRITNSRGDHILSQAEFDVKQLNEPAQ